MKKVYTLYTMQLHTMHEVRNDFKSEVAGPMFETCLQLRNKWNGIKNAVIQARLGSAVVPKPPLPGRITTSVESLRKDLSNENRAVLLNVKQLREDVGVDLTAPDEVNDLDHSVGGGRELDLDELFPGCDLLNKTD